MYYKESLNRSEEIRALAEISDLQIHKLVPSVENTSAKTKKKSKQESNFKFMLYEGLVLNLSSYVGFTILLFKESIKHGELTSEALHPVRKLIFNYVVQKH